jgi:hypothetical protein
VGASSNELLDRAIGRSHGLTDFGPEGWQEGFDQIVSAIPADLGDDKDAIRRIEEIVVDRLVNRLRIEQWYANIRMRLQPGTSKVS